MIVTITLEEAYFGATKKISYDTYFKCEKCVGSGSTGGTADYTACKTCAGHGKMRYQQGFFVVEKACDSCSGYGKIVKNKCSACSGNGRTMKRRNIEVSIPYGVSTGSRVRLSGQGEAGLRGGKSGDLYVVVAVSEHKIFHREGDNLHCTKTISFVDAALGGEATITAIDGQSITFKIPEGVDYGSNIRVPSKGMKIHNTQRFGDLIVNVKIETPKKLSQKQKDLLREFIK